MAISKRAAAALVASLVLGACGAQGGGQGLGFSNAVRSARTQRLNLQFVRFAPRQGDAAALPYIELRNASSGDLDLASTPLFLQSPHGRVSLPEQGVWPAQEALRIEGDALRPLALHAQAGELLLVGSNTAVQAYAAWGARTSDWPQGFAPLASRGGLPPSAVSPLPLALARHQAILFTPSDEDLGCTAADADFHADLVPEACEESRPSAGHITLTMVSGIDGRDAQLEIANDSPADALDLYGLRLCTPHGCRTLTESKALSGTAARSPQAGPSRLRLSVGRHAENTGADVVVALPPLQAGDEVRLLAPGESFGGEPARMLASTVRPAIVPASAR